MRTTIRLDDQLLAEARKHAADTGRTLTAVLDDALRESLARRRAVVERKPVRLKTVNGDGIRPSIDLDDSASLLDIMES